MANFLNYNGQFIDAGAAIINADNRGFRFGDGIFETFKIINGRIALAGGHFERLLEGIRLLEFEKPSWFTPAYLTDQVLQLCRKNGHESIARVRLMIFRGNGGLFDPENHFPNYIIQSWKIEPSTGLNEDGLVIDLYGSARKSIDQFSNLKSNNFLPYVMAALHAKKKKLNDCLLLNTNGNICESSIANVFIIKQGKVFTPSLSEGCVAGIMRGHILRNLHAFGIAHEECVISLKDVLSADEVFLTNSIQGIRWVRQFRDINYANTFTQIINHKLITEFLL